MRKVTPTTIAKEPTPVIVPLLNDLESSTAIATGVSVDVRIPT